MRPDDDPADPEETREPVDWAKANREDEELLLEALNAAPVGERRCRQHVPVRRLRGPRADAEFGARPSTGTAAR